MPNVVQKFARHCLKRIRHVTSSTSSPPIGQLPVDVTTGDGRVENDTTANDDVIQVVPDTKEECHFDEYGSTSDSFENHLLSDDTRNVPFQLETFKSLRISDALAESKRMQETYEEKPKLVNTKRLMKELRLTQKACAESGGVFEVEPCSDDDQMTGCDLSEWEVRFYKFDETSSLWMSMREHEIDCVKFRISFPSDFPLSPPFVRLVSPYIENGFVMNGGAICLEVLTSQGWSSVYTIEALLIQVATSLAHGGAVVSKHTKRKQHKLTKQKAEVEFKRISKIHNKYGWVKLDKNEG